MQTKIMIIIIIILVCTAQVSFPLDRQGDQVRKQTDGRALVERKWGEAIFSFSKFSAPTIAFLAF